jgi:rhodanese-related sulfurtransferase
MEWAMLRHPLAHVQDVSIAEGRPKLESGQWWLLDVREDEEWQRMHIPGRAPHPPVGARLAPVGDPSNAVPLVVCHSGVRSHRAAQFLKQADFPRV